MDITKKQKAVLAFVVRERKRRGFSPSLQEIAAHFGVTKTGARHHVEALLKKGALRGTYGVARSLVPVEGR